jgi:hypothetical protein
MVCKIGRAGTQGTETSENLWRNRAKNLILKKYSMKNVGNSLKLLI